MNKTLLILAFHIAFLTSAFGQTLSDSIILKKGFFGYKPYQHDNKLSGKKLFKTMESNPDALKQLKAASKIGAYSSVMAGMSYAMLGWCAGKEKPHWGVMGAAIGLVAVTVPLGYKRIKYLKGAIKTYNDGLKKAPILDTNEMKISMTGNGVGLLLTF